MSEILIWISSILLLSVTLAERKTDERWLKQPTKSEYGVLFGDDITLTWEYTAPSRTSDEGRLLFTRRATASSPLGDDFLDFLIEASINANKDGYTMKVMDSDKVDMDVKKNTIRITLLALEFEDTGHYPLNITFSRNQPDIHDNIHLVVYERPVIGEKTQNDIVRLPESHATLRYQLRHSPNYPDVASMIITLATNFKSGLSHQDSMIPVLVQVQLDSVTGTWQVEYPDEKFKDRVTFRYDPEDGLIQVTIWSLQDTDSGVVNLAVIYGDQLAFLRVENKLNVVQPDSCIPEYLGVVSCCKLLRLYMKSNNSLPFHRLQQLLKDKFAFSTIKI